MAVYIISYDLRKPDHDYNPLYTALYAHNAIRCLKSVWLIDTHISAMDLRNNLMNNLHSKDGLIVAKLSGETAWNKLEAGAEDWLRQKFGP